MKRFSAIVLTVILAVSMLSTGAFAHGHGGGHGVSRETPCVNREETNAVCQNHGESCEFIDEDGDGICDRKCVNDSYTDDDSDGVCDKRNSIREERKGHRSCGRRI